MEANEKVSERKDAHYVKTYPDYVPYSKPRVAFRLEHGAEDVMSLAEELVLSTDISKFIERQ